MNIYNEIENYVLEEDVLEALKGKNLKEQMSHYFVVEQDEGLRKTATPLDKYEAEEIFISNGYIVGARTKGKDIYIDRETPKEDLCLIIEYEKDGMGYIVVGSE